MEASDKCLESYCINSSYLSGLDLCCGTQMAVVMFPTNSQISTSSIIRPFKRPGSRYFVVKNLLVCLDYQLNAY